STCPWTWRLPRRPPAMHATGSRPPGTPWAASRCGPAARCCCWTRSWAWPTRWATTCCLPTPKKAASLPSTPPWPWTSRASSSTCRGCRSGIEPVRVRPGGAAALAYARAHERLHELPLEQQEPHQQRRGRQQRGCRDDRPVYALVGGREHLQAHGKGPRLHRIGNDQRPQEVVPVVADRYQPVGHVNGLGQRHVHFHQHLQ